MELNQNMHKMEYIPVRKGQLSGNRLLNLMWREYFPLTVSTDFTGN